jgi:hypothetical protein
MSNSELDSYINKYLKQLEHLSKTNPEKARELASSNLIRAGIAEKIDGVLVIKQLVVVYDKNNSNE